MISYSLRERKIAKQKIALMNEFIKQLAHTKFEDIVIKNVCENVEISEGTFYNYFPKKSDVIKLYKALQLAKMQWKLERQAPRSSIFDKLLFAIDSLTTSIKYYHALQEFNWVIIAEGIRHQNIEISSLELEYGLPEYAEISSYKSFCWTIFFEDLVKEAIKTKELPANCEVPSTARSLIFTICGVIFSIEEKEFPSLRDCCHRQLKLIWKGLQLC